MWDSSESEGSKNEVGVDAKVGRLWWAKQPMRGAVCDARCCYVRDVGGQEAAGTPPTSGERYPSHWPESGERKRRVHASRAAGGCVA